jgi:hypothetical protein
MQFTTNSVLIDFIHELLTKQLGWDEERMTTDSPDVYKYRKGDKRIIIQSWDKMSPPYVNLFSNEVTKDIPIARLELGTCLDNLLFHYFIK